MIASVEPNNNSASPPVPLQKSTLPPIQAEPHEKNIKKGPRNPFAFLFCCISTKSGSNSEPLELSAAAKKPVYGSAGGTSLLHPISPEEVGKKCLVLDLDETLVHSSFKPVAHADFIIPVEIDNQVCFFLKTLGNFHF